MKKKTEKDIVLVGLMSYGKTSVGKHLSTVFKHEFVDMGDFISKCEQLMVNEIFTQKANFINLLCIKKNFFYILSRITEVIFSQKLFSIMLYF